MRSESRFASALIVDDLRDGVDRPFMAELSQTLWRCLLGLVQTYTADNSGGKAHAIQRSLLRDLLVSDVAQCVGEPCIAPPATAWTFWCFGYPHAPSQARILIDRPRPAEAALNTVVANPRFSTNADVGW